MGQRCGCVGQECNCAIVPGRGVELFGTGDQTNPLVVTQSASAYVRASSTDSTTVTVTGYGTVAEPYLVGMDFVTGSGSKPLATSTFTTPGLHVWTRPVNCTFIEVTAIGGGAGGSAGLAPVGGVTYGFGGLGGQGGGYTSKVVVLRDGLTELDVAVGYGGSAGTTPGAIGGIGYPSEVIDWGAVSPSIPGLVFAGGGDPGGAIGAEAMYPGITGPISISDSRRVVRTFAGGGGGRGAWGSDDEGGAIYGGNHSAYNGMLGVFDHTTMYGAGDGGRGGRSFSNTLWVPNGQGTNGYNYGGGGGGGRGGAAGMVLNGSTWNFAPGAGGWGASGAVQIIAY